jgi:hypothetical protein
MKATSKNKMEETSESIKEELSHLLMLFRTRKSALEKMSKSIFKQEDKTDNINPNKEQL